MPGRSVGHQTKVGLAKKFGQGSPQSAQEMTQRSVQPTAQESEPEVEAPRCFARQVKESLPDAEVLKRASMVSEPLARASLGFVLIRVVETRGAALEGAEQGHVAALALESRRHRKSHQTAETKPGQEV